QRDHADEVKHCFWPFHDKTIGVGKFRLDCTRTRMGPIFRRTRHMQVKIINTACFGRPVSGQYAIRPLGNAKMLDSTAVGFGIVKDSTGKEP
ncbi:MAG: hypothetical protein ACP5MD_14115, partial [Verrucomicrobiia bacterium]